MTSCDDPRDTLGHGRLPCLVRTHKVSPATLLPRPCLPRTSKTALLACFGVGVGVGVGFRVRVHGNILIAAVFVEDIKAAFGRLMR